MGLIFVVGTPLLANFSSIFLLLLDVVLLLVLALPPAPSEQTFARHEFRKKKICNKKKIRIDATIFFSDLI